MSAQMTLADVRKEADAATYPTSVLEHCESALVLFAAAFLGRQDSIFIADAGLVATCVDNDGYRLREMAPLYPVDWTFVYGDAYEFARQADTHWDLVSVDCPSGDSFQRCADMIDCWCALARVAVVLGTDPGKRLAAPDGWRVSRRIRRSRIADWTVLERA